VHNVTTSDDDPICRRLARSLLHCVFPDHRSGIAHWMYEKWRTGCGRCDTATATVTIGVDDEPVTHIIAYRHAYTYSARSPGCSATEGNVRYLGLTRCYRSSPLPARSSTKRRHVKTLLEVFALSTPPCPSMTCSNDSTFGCHLSQDEAACRGSVVTITGTTSHRYDLHSKHRPRCLL
jgi:hypothetical protein